MQELRDKNGLVIALKMQEIDRMKKLIAVTRREIEKAERDINEWSDRIMQIKHEIHELDKND